MKNNKNTINYTKLFLLAFLSCCSRNGVAKAGEYEQKIAKTKSYPARLVKATVGGVILMGSAVLFIYGLYRWYYVSGTEQSETPIGDDDKEKKGRKRQTDEHRDQMKNYLQELNESESSHAQGGKSHQLVENESYKQGNKKQDQTDAYRDEIKNDKLPNESERYDVKEINSSQIGEKEHDKGGNEAGQVGVGVKKGNANLQENKGGQVDAAKKRGTNQHNQLSNNQENREESADNAAGKKKIPLPVRKKLIAEFNKMGLSSLQSLPEWKENPIWIFKNGCFRIAHASHIAGNLLLYRALKKTGYTNLKIILSPSHQYWIESKCATDKGQLGLKGKSYLVEPSHEDRVDLIKALLRNMKKKKMITSEEYDHIEVDEKLEKNDDADWPFVVRNLRKNNLGIKIIYCSGEDLVRSKRERLIEDHVAIRRDVANDVSTTNIINDPQYQKKLKEELPDYYQKVKKKFAGLGIFTI